MPEIDLVLFNGGLIIVGSENGKHPFRISVGENAGARGWVGYGDGGDGASVAVDDDNGGGDDTLMSVIMMPLVMMTMKGG